MRIGVPKEIKIHESRVGLTPAAVRELKANSHHVMVQKNAGMQIDLGDDKYRNAGAEIVETPQDAVNCFLTTGIDHLVIHDTIVSKAAMHKVVAPLVNVYADV
ncbi:MAG: hypothetical protein AABZ18_04305, partial [Pseudomonadota bacterium]